MNFCNVENQTRPYEGNAQKLSLKWSHVRFLLILPLSLKDPVLAMMHCSLGGIGKQKPRYHVNQSNAREKHYGQYWAFKCYSLHVQCNRTFPYSTSVLTNNSTRTRLGLRFWYISCIFAHPNLDSVSLFIGMRERIYCVKELLTNCKVRFYPEM